MRHDIGIALVSFSHSLTHTHTHSIVVNFVMKTNYYVWNTNKRSASRSSSCLSHFFTHSPPPHNHKPVKREREGTHFRKSSTYIKTISLIKFHFLLTLFLPFFLASILELLEFRRERLSLFLCPHLPDVTRIIEFPCKHTKISLSLCECVCVAANEKEMGFKWILLAERESETRKKKYEYWIWQKSFAFLLRLLHTMSSSFKKC